MAESYGLKSELEKSLNGKIRDLGFLCYNISLSNPAAYSEFKNDVCSIQKYYDVLNRLRSYNSDYKNIDKFTKLLDDEAKSLGFKCFNMYIDNRFYSDKLTELCCSISDISRQIFECQNKEETLNFADETADESSRNSNEHPDDEFKINLPFGMEPIPVNAKKCVCGYRNREYAKYCGKCGSKL